MLDISSSRETWKPPAKLAAYLARIGAEVRNFRRYVVKREGKDHYHYDATVIRVEDGVIICPDKKYEPTDEERIHIEAEIAAQIELKLWPHSITAHSADALRDMLPKDAVLYEYLTENGKEISFVQQRVVDDTLKKRDLPWSYWSDGHWRMMEPDTALPLWGLEKLRDAAKIFIHEGAKGALVCSDPDHWKDHPWRDELCGYGIAHLGWPGGAPNPHRVDWSPIQNFSRHRRVILVGDHDISGNNAVPQISRLIQRQCEAIKFGKIFPEHFDLADPWPAGNTTPFSDCLLSATWATRKVGDHFELREEFESQCNCVNKPQVFIHHSRPDRLYTDREFNGKFSPFSDVKNLTALLQKSSHAQCEALAFEPGLPTGSIALKNEGHVYNAYRPGSIRPVADDLTPWFSFLEHLFPVAEERRNVQRWIATLVARPDIKMRYGVLLISEAQGVGKDTLISGVIAPLLGRHNVSTPSEEQLIESAHNGWAYNKRLIHANEIYQGHSSKAYNKLKNIITDDVIDIHLKYLNAFPLRNWSHVIACSNSLRALKLDKGDRRWFLPSVSENKHDEAYWNELYAWLAGDGLPAIMHWAIEFVKEPENVVNTGEYPPPTARKKEVTTAAQSDGERFVAELGDRLKRHDGPALMRLDYVKTWLSFKKAAFNPQKYHNENYLESAETIASVLRGCGLVSPKLPKTDNHPERVKQYRTKDSPLFRVIANYTIDPDAPWAALEPLCFRPEDVWKWEDDLY